MNGSSWTRELVELAALLAAAATADLSADSFARVSGGTLVLGGLAVVLLVGAAVHHRRRLRQRAG